MNIDFERASFPTIRCITFTCHADHFQRIRIKEAYRRRASQSHDSLAMRESNEKTDEATKIARHSIGRRNACLLEALCHLNKNQRAVFLQTADEKFICCSRECVFNTLKGNVPLERREENRLSKYKTALRRIAAKRGNWKNKRKLLLQRGGFLPYIIRPILSILLSRIIDGSNS